MKIRLLINIIKNMLLMRYLIYNMKFKKCKSINFKKICLKIFKKNLNSKRQVDQQCLRYELSKQLKIHIKIELRFGYHLNFKK